MSADTKEDAGAAVSDKGPGEHPSGATSSTATVNNTNPAAPAAEQVPEAALQENKLHFTPPTSPKNEARNPPLSGANRGSRGVEQGSSKSPKEFKVVNSEATDSEKADAKKKNSTSRSRRERRERNAAQATVASGMYGWGADPSAWEYGAAGYPMDFDMAAMGMDPMAIGAMGMDPFSDPMMMGMGMGGYMDPMTTAFAGMEFQSSAPEKVKVATPLPSLSKSKTTEGKSASEGLSIHAKPWSPTSETAASSPPPLQPKDNTVELIQPSWTKVRAVNGVLDAAPVPMVPREVSNNVFVHSMPITPKSHPDVELQLLIYKCARCPLRTLYGRLSSRRADVTISNVAPDIPPMCLAHLLEQVAKVRVTALVASHPSSSTQYDLWLDKTNMTGPLISDITGSLWTCPIFHGFAVMAKSEAARAYLVNYLTQLKEAPEAEKSIYPLTYVEIREH